MQPCGVILIGEKLLFMWSRDQCLAKREKMHHFSLALGFGIALGLRYDSVNWFGLGTRLGFGSEIREPGL